MNGQLHAPDVSPREKRTLPLMNWTRGSVASDIFKC